MLTLTPRAVAKALEIMKKQNFSHENTVLRIGVRGGGCSGFQYDMFFDGKEKIQSDDEIYGFEHTDSSGQIQKLQIAVDQRSKLYLEGISIDYVETIEAVGFRFDNPNTKSSCGCGESFQV